MNKVISWIKEHGQIVAIIFISIMYTVGIVQLAFLQRPEVLDLTPLQLIFSTLLVLLYQKASTDNIIRWFAIFLFGFLIEVVGVNTGFPFGSYTYGPILGFKLWSTPLIIGLNWLLVIICTSQLSDIILSQSKAIWRATLSASLALGLDYLIEPVAVKTNMWTWSEQHIPVSNFIAWWVIAWLLSYLYQSQEKQNTQPVILVIFTWLIFFFASLNIAL